MRKINFGVPDEPVNETRKEVMEFGGRLFADLSSLKIRTSLGDEATVECTKERKDGKTAKACFDLWEAYVYAEKTTGKDAEYGKKTWKTAMYVDAKMREMQAENDELKKDLSFGQAFGEAMQGLQYAADVSTATDGGGEEEALVMYGAIPGLGCGPKAIAEKARPMREAVEAGENTMEKLVNQKEYAIARQYVRPELASFGKLVVDRLRKDGVSVRFGEAIVGCDGRKFGIVCTGGIDKPMAFFGLEELYEYAKEQCAQDEFVSMQNRTTKAYQYIRQQLKG